MKLMKFLHLIQIDIIYELRIGKSLLETTTRLFKSSRWFLFFVLLCFVLLFIKDLRISCKDVKTQWSETTKLVNSFVIFVFDTALLQIMGFSWFLTTPAGLAMVVSTVWPLGLLLCPFIRNWKFVRRWPWFFAKQVIRDLVLSCIVFE